MKQILLVCNAGMSTSMLVKNFNDTVKEALQDLEIPIICDADIGHVKPQLAIVNGAILEITSQNGKGTVKTILE